MTREEARQNLVALGLQEPTDEQVTNYLNQFHANRNNPPAPQPVPAPVPQPQPEPAPNDEMEKLRKQIADLQSENAKKDILAYATQKGLTGEHVENILSAYGDNVDAAKASIDAICNVISARETAAATAKEQEIAGKANNPGGGSDKGETKTTAESLVEQYFGGNQQDTDILNHYM